MNMMGDLQVSTNLQKQWRFLEPFLVRCVPDFVSALVEEVGAIQEIQKLHRSRIRDKP